MLESFDYKQSSDEYFFIPEPKTSENVFQAFEELIQPYKQVSLYVDHEGVILPYPYTSFIGNYSESAEFDKRVEHSLNKLPRNETLITMLKMFSEIGKKVIITSSSGYDVVEPILFQKQPYALQYARVRAHDTLEKINNDKLFHLNIPLQPNSLAVFFNDIHEKGFPPRSLLQSVMTSQNHGDSLQLITVPVPRFTLDVERSDYDVILRNTLFDAFISPPLGVEDINSYLMK